jgi:hypothetical protein
LLLGQLQAVEGVEAQAACASGSTELQPAIDPVQEMLGIDSKTLAR